MKQLLTLLLLLCSYMLCGAQASNVPFRVNMVGHETFSKPSLKNRLDGCHEITIVYPNRLRNQTDRYIFGNLVYYFQKLGLHTNVVEVPYEVKQPQQGIIQFFRKDGFENYLNNTNQLIVLPQLVSGFPDIERFYIGIYDPANDWAWEFNFEPKNKVDKYLQQLASYITPQINYSPDKLMSFRPPFIVANWNNENTYRSTMAQLGYDPYEGIYESDNYRAFLKRHTDGNYYLVYLDGCNYNFWQNGGGTVKSVLRPTASSGVFKADWWDAYGVRDKHSWNAIFSPGLISFIDPDGDKTLFIKMYPNSEESTPTASEGKEWSGTGFALKNGYITTNYHVIENSNSIWIRGIKGNFAKRYKAEVIVSDKFNDLAIIKISDPSFTGFGNIPYSVTTKTADVGEDIFVLGYPLTSTMGDEIKLTTGVVSSRTGFQGDVSLYQISAPIQPGNSGGPLFDSNGNVIGIVSSKHTGAENVGYAIKASYLRNLMESGLSANILPSTNSVSTLSLSNKVKNEKNFVFFIECSSASGASVQSATYNNSSSSSKVYNHPAITHKGNNKLTLVSVTVSPESTVLELSSNNSYPGGYYQWFSISPDAYISVNGIKYKLRSADGIALAPSVTYFSHANETKTFRLIFPPIPSNISSFDFIESQDSEWKLLGIKLR